MAFRSGFRGALSALSVFVIVASCAASEDASPNDSSGVGGANGGGGASSASGHGGASSSAGGGGTTTQSTASTASASTAASGGAGGGTAAMSSTVASSAAGTCAQQCSSDFHAILDCNGVVVETCANTDGCDPATKKCSNACAVAVTNKQTVGCEYYATDMDRTEDTLKDNCFAAFVANTWNTPVHIDVHYQGQALFTPNFTRIPQGTGQGITYAPYDPAVGLPPGDVAIVVLGGAMGPTPQCPVPSAAQSPMFQGTGISDSFQITTDVPVVAYQIAPYGGGSAGVTGSSLLLPTSTWDVNYVAANAYAYDPAIGATSTPSLNIIAEQDGTIVTLTPTKAVLGGGGIPAGPANQPLNITLNKGQHAQISQQEELTGSVIQSNKPIGLMGGQRCLQIPLGVQFCDHAEQMIPPVRALGSEYVGVMYRPRAGEPAIWRVIGVVDGTVLQYSSDVGGPPSLDLGQIGEFTTGTPFTVKSQDAAHPFMLFEYMSGSQWSMMTKPDYGDPEFVISVPPQQYLPSYVFYTDPTYPETNLVIVREKANGAFADVSLDCAGVLGGWEDVGEYEWTRIDLITGNFANVGNCSTGPHTITSTAPFGLWIWGWGSPQTSIFTKYVSYGYPGGMNVVPINNVVAHM